MFFKNMDRSTLSIAKFVCNCFARGLFPRIHIFNGVNINHATASGELKLFGIKTNMWAPSSSSTALLDFLGLLF